MNSPTSKIPFLKSRHGLQMLIILMALCVGFLTRLALAAMSAADVSWGPSLAASIFLGACFDAATMLLWMTPLALLLSLLPRNFFHWRLGRFLAHCGLLGAATLMVFGLIAELLFWQEFGVRANFIAVDYLVYTTEVLGNIRESYPMSWIVGATLAGSALLLWVFVKIGFVRLWLSHAATPFRQRALAGLLWCATGIILGLGLNQEWLPALGNNYNRELAKNGLWSFAAAFRANELSFDPFYPTMELPAAFAMQHKLHEADRGAERLGENQDLLRVVMAPRPGDELYPNVIQITVESLSACFLGHFGNKDGLTPHLDNLAKQSLVFENFYATGTRTVRGMEALSLSVPPTPGRSLVKRPDNGHLFTLGSVFRSKGYETSFIYGGHGYFDNMNAFFSGNGYKVLDRTGVSDKDITFSNAWGACDEDLLDWVIKEADGATARGHPFFHFVMTTSNHRPYTFPAGRIDLPSKLSGRSGGVKYTDYAINRFLTQAATKPWFKNTIFVIVADHCGSSAGKTELPVQNYHIPLIIYSPGGLIPTGSVNKLASQIDYAPTLLGLLNWSYPSRFFGMNVLLDPEAPGRAFIANYQKLGLYQEGRLEVLKPVRRAESFNYNEETRALTGVPQERNLLEQTVSAYQCAAWLFSHHKQGELSKEELARLVPALDSIETLVAKNAPTTK